MKKCFPIGIFLITCLCFFSGCFGPGTQDWDLSLKNGYEIWRINSQEIVLGRVEDEILESVVDADITAYFTSGSFVGVKQTPVDTEETKYYLLDMDSGTLYGPFDEVGFITQCKESGVEKAAWISTRPAPKDAKYE